MVLIIASVSRGATILAEHSTGRRDFSQAVHTILSKIPPNDSKLTYVWESYLFHYVSERGLTFLVMADDSLGRRMPFTFLGDLQRSFDSSYDGTYAQTADPSSFAPFGDEIAKMMDKYNTAPPPDALAQAQNELAQVKDIMVHNVEQILSRGERIELLVDKTDHLSGQAHAFRRGARQVRREQFWRNQKILAIGIFAGLLFLYLFIASFCGLGLHCGA
ncbi:snare-like protein [Exidia glandulosa HHB12029]|uniref:Synaptobrevin homolog YKT6 n=1 Tax=Exidia glandulosa HHB12029 TaxID=1314781 RepID=A0A165NRL2_EXIGL|nr:snare-like protein [Exidia glandulosa HHB12029]